MCGIVGILNRKENTPVALDKAIKCLQHRGPDDNGIWSDHYIQLGHTRLSILDLSSSGHQPMSYKNERYYITFNGEIYNYLELRQELTSLGYSFASQTDTEIIMAAYAQWRENCLEKLRGMFSFAIWDRHEKTLFLARDRTGEKPLYYYHDDRAFYFASELKALISMMPHSPELEAEAIDLYLHYQYIPEPRTALIGVHKLPAAHYLLLSPSQWANNPQCYWSIENIQAVEGNPAQLIRAELEDIINLVLRSDVPVGVALSGGIDSGAITTLAAGKYKNTLQTFSIGYPGYPPYDERREAQSLAASLGLPFTATELRTEDLIPFFPTLVKIIDEPIADIAAYGHYSVMKLAAENGVKVMLSGIGGDELFWGYSWIVEAVRLTESKQTLLSSFNLPSPVWETLETMSETPLYQKFLHSTKLPRVVKNIFKQGFELGKMNLSHPKRGVYQNLVPDFRFTVGAAAKIYHPDFIARLPAHHPYRVFNFDPNCSDVKIWMCQLVFQTWLVSNCLSLSDRVSMASGVETRTPLVDHKLIELVIGLRKSYDDHQLGHKFWLKSALKGILPLEVLERPKRGFQPPVNEWMSGLIDTYFHYLQDGYLTSMGIFQPVAIDSLRKNISNNPYNLSMLYKLLLLELWYAQVVMGEYR